MIANGKCRWPKENGLHFQLISLDGVPLGAETVDTIGSPGYLSNWKLIGPSRSRNPRCRRIVCRIDWVVEYGWHVDQVVEFESWNRHDDAVAEK